MTVIFPAPLDIIFIKLIPKVYRVVIFYDEDDRIINQSYTNDRGQFRLTLPAGSYEARVEHGPTISPKSSFVVRSGGGASLRLARLTPATVHVEIRGEDQRALPALPFPPLSSSLVRRWRWWSQSCT